MIIVRAENIEIAMQGFSNPSHKDRRRIIAEKSKPISLNLKQTKEKPVIEGNESVSVKEYAPDL